VPESVIAEIPVEKPTEQSEEDGTGDAKQG
jgi:hypothetical protein